MVIRNVSPGRNLVHTSTGYSFRMRVPLRYRDHFQRREFKKALHTTDAREAQKKALLITALIDEHIAQLDAARGYRMSKLPFFNEIKIAEVSVSLQGIKLVGVEKDPQFPEAEDRALRDTISAAREEFQTLLSQQSVIDQQITQGIAELSKQPVVSQPVIPASAPQKLLAELIDDFVKEKTTSGSWNKAAANGRKEQLLRGLEHFGDCDITTITRNDARDFLDILSKLPPNLKKNRSFANMSLAQAAAKNVRGVTISAKSVNMAMTDLASFFKWCVRCGYLVRNVFEGLSVKETSQAITQRLPYTHPELQQLFQDHYFQQHECDASEFFLPLLGLYQGARLNELCQLHTKDIYEIDGIWVIDINENDAEKSLKTADSKRILPLHPELIRLNFLKYVQSLKSGRVFPNLPYSKGKFSGAYSKRFATVRRRVKIVARDYYSFRHLVSSELEKLKVPEHMVAVILGHKHPQITFGRYGGPKDIPPLLAIVSQLKFNINVPPWPEVKIVRGRALQKIREIAPTLKASDGSLDEITKLTSRVRHKT